MENESFAEKFLYRLIKKHISGSTMSSALDRAKSMNDKSIPATITFLSNVPENKAKAKYITSTYIELIRRISRSGLKASIQVPLAQIGAHIDRDASISNFTEILEAGKRYGVFIWAETEEPSLLSKLKEARGYGLATTLERARDHLKVNKPTSLKILFDGFSEHLDPKIEHKNIDLDEIEVLSKNAKMLVLSFLPENHLWKLLKKQKFRKSLIFEVQLGSSMRKLQKVQKKGTKACVYIPFGKDWVEYAMNNVPEGYTRFLAGNLLNEGA